MFKRRAGLGGLRTFVGPMRRDDPATGGAGGADAAAGGGGGTPPAPPAPAPGTPPTPPAAGATDVTQTPEYRAAVAKAAADADAKARLAAKDNARQELLKELGTALGMAPAKATDPAQVAQEAAALKAENAELRAKLAVGDAARKHDADADMVTAMLAHKGLLKGLDPAAADYASKVEALVKAEVEGNPKLKNGTAAPTLTPGNSGPAAGGMGRGAGEQGARPGLHDAIAAAMKR